MIEWHYMLSMTLTDFFSDTNYKVEAEKELKISQFLDFLVVEGDMGKPIPEEEMPDGLEDIAEYNLFSYKSMHQALDSWTIDELISYYVLFRKIASPSLDNLLSFEKFRLFGISTRFPKKLQAEENLVKIKKGVYSIKRGLHEIKIIVLIDMNKEQKNAIWNMFGIDPNMIQYGLENYNWKRDDFRKSLSQQLIEKYKSEGVIMSYTEKDFFRDFVLSHLHQVSTEEIAKRIKPSDIFKYYEPEDRLKGLNPEDIFKHYEPADIFKHYEPEDRLKGLSTKQIEDYLSKLRTMNNQ